MKNTFYLSILVLIAGLIASVSGFITNTQSYALQAEGILVRSIDSKGNTDIIKNGSHSIKEIAPKFKTKTGETHRCRAKIDDKMMTTLKVDPVVDILYLSDKPNVCSIVGSQQKNGSTLIMVGIISIIGSLIAMIKTHKKDNEDAL